MNIFTSFNKQSEFLSQPLLCSSLGERKHELWNCYDDQECLYQYCKIYFPRVRGFGMLIGLYLLQFKKNVVSKPGSLWMFSGFRSGISWSLKVHAYRNGKLSILAIKWLNILSYCCLKKHSNTKNKLFYLW